MLIWLAKWLGLTGGDPSAPLQLVTVRAGAAALTAFILMLLIMPGVIRWLKRKKFGEQGGKGQGADLVDAYREGKKGTPTMGGLGLVLCIALAAILWCDPNEPRVWLLLGGMLGFAVVGFLDDRTKIFQGAKGTSTFVKLGIQLGTALVCGVGLYLITQHDAASLLPGNTPAGFPGWYKKELAGDIFTVRLATDQLAFPYLPVENAINLGVWSVAWTVFVMAACANGVNFTDGMDGLAAGTMLIAVLAFLVIAYLTSRVDTADYLHLLYVSGGQEVAVFCAATAGACLGFLWFNSAPAQVFMGDTGSQALGGILGLVALNTKQELLVVLVGFIFVIEAASVAIQIVSFRCFGGRRVFRCAPLHHHYQYAGLPESKIVLRFWVIAALVALLALGALLAVANLRHG